MLEATQYKVGVQHFPDGYEGYVAAYYDKSTILRRNTGKVQKNAIRAFFDAAHLKAEMMKEEHATAV